MKGALVLFVIIFAFLIVACQGEPVAVAIPEDTPAPQPTYTPLPTLEPSPTATLAPTALPTATVTPPTATPVPPTNTPVPTFTPKPKPTATAKPTPTRTPRPTFTPRPTNTPAPPNPLAGLENADWLERNAGWRVSKIKTLPWIADGVGDSEREAAELLIAAARWYPDTFGALVGLPWVEDSITRAETHAIYGLRWAARYSPEVAELMLQKSWTRDDITVDEATVIRYLHWMGWYEDEPNQEVVETIIQMLNMSFLDRVAGADAAAVRSLRRIEYNDTATFLEIMNHPKLKDGITDEEAKIVALLSGTYEYRPESVNVLLRGTGVHLEERAIELPHSGEVLLAIIRIRDQVTPNMDYLEHSVRTIEEFMSEPLPTGYVALYFDDANVRSGGGAGTNFGTHMAMSLNYDVENGRLWERAPSTIAHEVAHYYWRGNSRDWLDEGPANFLESIAENARIDAPIEVRSNPCAAADTISELESVAVHRETWRETVAQNWFRCNYSLGERLFVDLYGTLGEETFRRGFRSLWLKSQAEDYSDDCEGADLTVCHVAAAFKEDVSDDVAAKVDAVLNRWYGPRP